MTPDMIAALQQGRAMATGFFEFRFPSGTRRLMLGSGEVSSSESILDEDGSPILDETGQAIQDEQGVTFRGTDETFGTVAAGEGIREDATGEAPNTSITITVYPEADKSEIASEAVQLTPVSISLAAIALDGNGHVIAVPEPEGLGDYFIDQPVIGVGDKRDEVEYSLISAFDYFFEDSEGQRLNSEFHKTMFSGETGLDNITGVTRKIYWGAYGPGGAGGATTGGGGVSRTGGGFLTNNLRSV